MQPIDCQMCKTGNPEYSVDAHFGMGQRACYLPFRP